MFVCHKDNRGTCRSNNKEAKIVFLHLCFPWANSYTPRETTTAVTINPVPRARAASQPTGLMADWERRRVSALSYHNTVWHTWTTVTSINTQWLPHCLAERQIMRPVFALDFWFNVLFFFIDSERRAKTWPKNYSADTDGYLWTWLLNICKTHMLRLKWFVYHKGWILGKNRSGTEDVLQTLSQKAMHLLQLHNHKSLLLVRLWTWKM